MNERKQKFLHALLPFIAAALLAVSCTSTANTMESGAFSVWDGLTPEPSSQKFSTYEIKSAAQLAALSKLTSFPEGAVYTLKTNIDLAGHEWKPIGKDSQTSNRFNGTFNGNGFTIKGLKLPDTQHSGLFGFVRGTKDKNALIKNLNIELVTSTLDNGYVHYVGALAGTTLYAELENISITGEINIKTASLYAGGIVGNSEVTVITNSNARVNITANSLEAARVGGIAGNNSGKISSCFAIGTIKLESINDAICGGIVGDTKDLVHASYTNMHIDVITKVQHSDNFSCELTIAGGIAGYSRGTISSCYSTGSTSVTAAAASCGASVGGITGRGQTVLSCYATGDVIAEAKSKMVQAGGIIGVVNSTSTIERCAALNLNIEANGIQGSTAGRIAGENKYGNKPTFTNNVANVTMKVTQAKKVITSFKADIKHGENIKPELLTGTIFARSDTQLKTDTAGNILSGGLGWNTTEWSLTEKSLPKLKFKTE